MTLPIKTPNDCHNTGGRHPKGFIHVAVITAAEFFSYYGMRSLLVLFFTQYLLLSDQKAYTLYGAYTSLVWVTPIIGGYLADKVLGYHYSVTLGAIMLFLGNLILVFSGNHIMLIYLAMSVIICGYGFFKGNISCLASELYTEEDPLRNVGFSWLYVAGNIGGLIAILACGWTAYLLHSWHAGFALASTCLFVGILFFLSGKKHFKHSFKETPANLSRRFPFFLKNRSVLMVMIIAAIAFFIALIHYQLDGYFLVLIAIIAIGLLANITRQSTIIEKKSIALICLFMVFGTIFWVFDQQNGSSVILFIQRNIDRHILGITIPTASFQSVNAASVILGGFLVAWLWRFVARKNIHIPSLIKLSIGCIFLTAGFMLITLSAKLASHSPTGQSHILWIIVGMILIGIAELFVDPVAIANITRLNPANSSGLLVGIYILITGAFANYIAGQVASLTDVGQHHLVAAKSLMESASIYEEAFKNISIVGTIVTVLIVTSGFIIHRLLKVKEEYE